MTKNPYVNALAALAYVAGVVSLIYFGGPTVLGPEETILIPMAMLSLFVVSAATMGYIFLYQPLMMFLEGYKKEAANLFLITIAAFGGITALLFMAQAAVQIALR